MVNFNAGAYYLYFVVLVAWTCKLGFLLPAIIIAQSCGQKKHSPKPLLVKFMKRNKIHKLQFNSTFILVTRNSYIFNNIEFRTCFEKPSFQQILLLSL